MKANNLDALLFPGPASAGIASKPGYPTVLVPFGMIPNTPGNLGGGGGGGGRGDAPPATPAAAPPGAAPAAAPPGDGRGATPPPPFPPGFDPKPQPYGVGFTGSACSEPKLLRLAYAFEQATKKRTPPPGLR